MACFCLLFLLTSCFLPSALYLLDLTTLQYIAMGCHGLQAFEFKMIWDMDGYGHD